MGGKLKVPRKSHAKKDPAKAEAFKAELPAKLDAVVDPIGVSTDSVEKQKEFKTVNNFPFPLLADSDKKVVKAFGQSAMMFASRECYVIKGGKIVYKDTGVTSTSPLIAYIDTITGFPLATNGGDIQIIWDSGANKIFAL